MGIRRAVGTGMEKVVGEQRVQRIRQGEARARRRLIAALDVEARAPQPVRPVKAKKPPLTREQQIERLGRATPEGLGAGSVLPKGLTWVSPDPFPDYPRTGATCRELLAGMHEQLRPADLPRDRREHG